MKKLLNLAFALTLMVCLFAFGSTTASADYKEGDYTYTVTNGEATIYDYTGAGGDVIIPDTLGGYPVTTIGDDAFYWCDSLTSLTIGNSVTTIGDSAFSDCYSLTSVTIPDSVTIIGDYAFEWCYSLNSVTIGNSVTNIGNNAFSGCPYLTSVTIGNSITNIGNYAFWDCASLTSVTIPNSVTTIGDFAFYYCASLTDVHYSGTEADRAKISIGSSNDDLLNATWHYKETSKVTISKQPANVCVANGEKATVKVSATGEGLTYKWYFKDAGASKYTYTSSFKGNSYSITMTDARAGRRVLCIVYDKYGNSVQSKSVLLSQAVRITKQPANACVEYGETVTVKVVAKGEGLTYKWYFKDAGASSYKLTTSFTGNTYTTTMNDARAGRRVLCKVYDKYGNMVKSSSALLSQAVRITKQPVSVTVSEGSTAKVAVKAVGDGLTYKWYFKDAGASSYKYTSSFKGSSYSVTMTDARAGRRVLCKVYDKYGNKVQSNTVILKMK